MKLGTSVPFFLPKIWDINRILIMINWKLMQEERYLTDKELKNLIITQYVSISPFKITILKKRLLNNNILYNVVLNRTKSCKGNLGERIYWILYDMYSHNKCEMCDNLIYTKHTFSLKQGYKKHCSPKCAGANPQVKQLIIDVNMEKFGVPVSSQNIEVKRKQHETNLIKYNSISPFGNKEVQQKSENTKLHRYGNKNYIHSDIGKERVKQSNLAKYNVEYTFQRSDVKQKMKETNIKNYGVEYATQHPEIKNKMKQTNNERYGGNAPICSKEVFDKMVKTNNELYGCNNAMQNPDIFHKQQKNSYYKREYSLPSGKVILIQGYENIAIDTLLKQFDEDDLELQNIPRITYLNNSKYYFPDIFIPKLNKIIEVKSEYTYNKQLDKNLLKAQAVIDSGYEFEFWICSNKEVLEIKPMKKANG